MAGLTIVVFNLIFFVTNWVNLQCGKFILSWVFFYYVTDWDYWKELFMQYKHALYLVELLLL